MIIADEDDTQKIKDPPVALPTVRYPDRVASRRPFSPLPDYETSQALALGGLNDSQATLYKPSPGRRLFGSRLWRATIISFVVYIFLTLAIGVPFIVHKVTENQVKYPFNALTYAIGWSGKAPLPFSGDVNNTTSPNQSGTYPVCNNFTAVEYLGATAVPVVLAATEIEVSPTGQFSFASNASTTDDFNLVQGAFYAGINPNQSVQNAVLSVTMQASSPSVFNQTFTCFTIAENFTDLSLYIPDNLSSADTILYNITLLFPQTATPFRVDSFSTLLPMFDQRFGYFGESVSFDTLSIEGPISRVTADFVQANRLLVDTSLEQVTGTFHAETSLLVSTVMAPIIANISLYNDPNSQYPTFLDLHTGNSTLIANITVLAPNKNPPLRPNFIANVRTFSGPLSVNVSHDPASPPSIIQLRAVNDLGPIDVVVDSLFEGAFQMSTTQASASLIQGNASAPNPWAPGQQRTMTVDLNSTARSYGCIGWGNAMTPWTAYQAGEMIVDSTLADVMLLFLG